MTLRSRSRARRLAPLAACALLLAGASPAAALCGDGVFDAGEECDDGNLVNGDCCSTTCALLACSSPSQPGVAWEELGPFDVGGRVTSLAVDPANPDLVLVGTPAAGVFRSEDRGLSWVAIAPWLDVAPVSAIAIDPDDADRYVIGTGILRDSGAVGDALGSMQTADAAVSWSFQADPTRTAYVADILIWPGEPQRVLFATDRGLMLSLDGGTTRSEVVTGDSFTSLVADPFAADVVYASGRHGAYESADRGASWTFLSSWPGVDEDENPGVATAALDASQQTPGLLRAAVQDLATFVDTDRVILLESTDGGQSWSELPTPAAWCPAAATDLCGFANALAIDPFDDARMLLGGDRLFSTDDGGQSWTPLDPTIRGVHAIAIDAAGAVVAGRSGVAALDASWQVSTSLDDGLPITQIVGLDAQPDGSGALLAATRDSGTVLGDGDPFEWQVVYGANEAASEARFDPFDPDVLYAGLRRGDFSRSDDGGATWNTITNGLDPTQIAADVAPLAVNPLVEGELFTGRLQLFRTDDRGDDWQIHRPLGAPEIAQISPSPVIYDRLYFSLARGGTLFKNDSIHTDSFVLDAALDARITSIYPDPAAENRVYVTMTNAATLEGSLWRTENFGVDWEDRAFGKLPAVNDVVRDEFGALYVATPKGVRRSVSEGFVWSPFDEGLPTRNVTELVADRGFVVAGTRGRGVFQVAAKPLVTVDTIPPGQRLLVDGIVRAGPVYEDWLPGSEHTLEPYLLQTQDTRQEFVGWIDGAPQVRTFTATGDNEWPTALVEVLHRLTTQVSPPEGGVLVIEPQSADGFYPLTSFVQLIAVPSSDYRISGWSGDVVSVDRILAGASMEGPRSVTAHFDPLLIQFSTQPPGLEIDIDGETVALPRTYQWDKGSVHPLDPPPSVDLDPNNPIELVFDRWSDYLPRSHDFEMRSETFTADVTAYYIPTVRQTTVPAGGVQLLATVGQQDPRREVALTIAPAPGETLPASIQFLRSTAEAGLVNELALARAAAVARVDTWVEGRVLTENGGLTGDGRIRRTRLALFNSSSQEASIDLVLRGTDGAALAGGTDVLRLAPGAHRVAMLDELLGLPPSYDGVLALISSVPIGVAVLGVTENLRELDFTDPILFHLFDESDTGVPVQASLQVLLATPDTEHVIALINPASTATTGTLYVLDATGAALEAEVDGAPATSVAFALGGGEHRVLRLVFPNGVPGASTVPHARVEVATASGPPPLVRSLEERAIGTTRYGTSTLPRSLPAGPETSTFVLPVDLSRRDAGVVLCNRGAVQVDVTLTLRDPHGAAVDTWIEPVPAGEQREVLVGELSPPPPAGFYGLLDASADAPVVAVGFSRTTNGRGEEILAGLPVATPPTEPPDATHSYPYAVDGDTWSSEWWLLSEQGAPRTAALQFSDGTGTPRYLPMNAPGTP